VLTRRDDVTADRRRRTASLEGPPSRAERRFDEIAARFLTRRGVTPGTGFGTSIGLRVGGKIFAFVSREQLVVKLPKDRVEHLIDSGHGTRFDPGHGRLMKEWVSVPTTRGREWEGLVEAAMRFVESGARSRPGRR